jgi:hypothetical protein
VLCLPVGGAADEWFLSNPIREYNELMALLARRRGESLLPPEEPEEFFQMKIECDDDYPVVAMLDDNTRVVESVDRVQWIVQKKGEHVWNGVHFCPTKAEACSLRKADHSRGAGITRSVPHTREIKGKH